MAKKRHERIDAELKVRADFRRKKSFQLYFRCHKSLSPVFAMEEIPFNWISGGRNG